MSLHTIIVSETSYAHIPILRLFLKWQVEINTLFQVLRHFLMESLHFQARFPILVCSKISFDYSLFSECCSPLDSRVLN